jgi:hypothetical protein
MSLCLVPKCFGTTTVASKRKSTVRRMVWKSKVILVVGCRLLLASLRFEFIIFVFMAHPAV